MIRFHHLTKRYAAVVAVHDLTLTIEKGEVIALLGPNGSGKTTSLKALAGLVRPTSGSVTIQGLEAFVPQARRVASFLPQKVAFPEGLSGREVVTFYQRLRGVDSSRVGAALRLASLNGASDRGTGTYSGGMLQRLGLAVATMPDAPLLLLDEPTAALDSEGLSVFYQLVEQRQRQEKTIVFTSHQLGDAEKLADRFAILVEGHLVALLTRRDLADRLAAGGLLRLRVSGSASFVLDRIREIAPAAYLAADELIVPGSATIRPAVIDIVRNAGIEIRGLTTEESRMDGLYRELVRGA